MLFWTLTILVLAILALLAYAWMKPDDFETRRTASIAAPPEKIFPLISDLRAFNTWNPFVQDDPGNRGTYSGPAGGKGAAYAFEGGKSGSGRFVITGATPPNKLVMDLNMFKPFRGDNVVEFTLKPNASATTDVTWAMRGKSTFVPRLMGVFMNMDEMVGGQFAKGLANLKALAEK